MPLSGLLCESVYEQKPRYLKSNAHSRRYRPRFGCLLPYLFGIRSVRTLFGARGRFLTAVG